ncbi:hypothetical protein [Streptomyces sp. NPDC004533]|uniref:hypothetical protein n=1 Tax=Streptomyces sp. NPDC004533 TaxID=3154278 RepID=UPI00339E1D65
MVAFKQLVRVLIDHARRFREELVHTGQPLPALTPGLLDEQRWQEWLRAAWDEVPPDDRLTIRDADPEDLGVHRAVSHAQASSGTAGSSGFNRLTPYLAREHDYRLRRHLAAAASGGPSVFVLLLGDSTTGKTRALYEAVFVEAPDHALLRPVDAEDLRQILTAGRATPGTVLWLNETQRYLYGPDGSTNAKDINKLLATQPGILLVGAMWRHPYFVELTAQGRPESFGPVRDLLHSRHTVRLDVPDALTTAQLDEFRALATDPAPRMRDRRLIDALEAAGGDGRVIQYLSGGPELLEAYRNRTLFTHVEHALITAALDARRLGHRQPLPGALLAEAADGYLSDRQRPTAPDWAETTLGALTRGYRNSDLFDRTDIRHTLTALVMHVSRSGTRPSFEPADYLDQQTHDDRSACLGPPALWHALITRTHDPEDLHAIGQNAERRGLFKAAANLYKNAVLAGYPYAAVSLLQLLRRHNLDPQCQAMRWLAARIDVADALNAAQALREVRHTGTPTEVVHELAERAAAHADPADPVRVARLLRELHEAGEAGSVSRLASRAVADTDPEEPAWAAILLEALSEVGEATAAAQMSPRAAAQADPGHPGDAADLLRVLHKLSQTDAVRTLARRAAAHTDAANPLVQRLLNDLHAAGESEHVRKLAARAAAHMDAKDSETVPELLRALHKLGQTDAVHSLAMRAAAHTDHSAALLRTFKVVGEPAAIEQFILRAKNHTAPENPWTVRGVIETLREAGETEAAHELADLASACVALDRPDGVTVLLRMFREIGEMQAGEQLAARAAEQVDPANHHSSQLLKELQAAGAAKAAHVLAGRIVALADPTHPDAAANVLQSLSAAGETDAFRRYAARVATRTENPSRIRVAAS